MSPNCAKLGVSLHQWIAYSSSGNGRTEVYVRPYPGPEPATRISVDGGSRAAWSPDGRQIYFTAALSDLRGAASRPMRALMAVDVTPGADFQVGRPAPLLEQWTSGCDPTRCYDVFPDGSVVTTAADEEVGTALERAGTTDIHVALNFFEELKARVGN